MLPCCTLVHTYILFLLLCPLFIFNLIFSFNFTHARGRDTWRIDWHVWLYRNVFLWFLWILNVVFQILFSVVILLIAPSQSQDKLAETVNVSRRTVKKNRPYFLCYFILEKKEEKSRVLQKRQHIYIKIQMKNHQMAVFYGSGGALMESACVFVCWFSFFSLIILNWGEQILKLKYHFFFVVGIPVWLSEQNWQSIDSIGYIPIACSSLAGISGPCSNCVLRWRRNYGQNNIFLLEQLSQQKSLKIQH